jgi:hypothetical protein
LSTKPASASLAGVRGDRCEGHEEEVVVEEEKKEAKRD